MATKKIQFGFTPTTLRVLDNLRKGTGATSLAEVIRNSIVLYDWALQTVSNGGKLLSADQKGDIKEVILPKIPK